MSSVSHAGPVDGAEPVGVAPRTWLRNPRRTRAWASIATAWSLCFTCVVFIPGRLPTHGAVAASLASIAFYVGVGVAGLVLAGRVARAGVWIRPDAVVIRGPFRTHSIALADAGRFVPGLQGRGGNGVPCPMLERAGQAAVGVWALGRRNIWFRYARICDELQPLCDDLNRLLDAPRPDRMPSGLTTGGPTSPRDR